MSDVKVNRKQKRYIERLEKKANKKTHNISTDTKLSALEQIKRDTREEIGKRLDPIIYGMNS